MKSLIIIFILVLSSAAWAFPKQRVGELIARLRPGADFTVRGDKRYSIEWRDQVQIQPTKKELQAEWVRLKQENKDRDDKEESKGQMRKALRAQLDSIDSMDLDQLKQFVKDLAGVLL